MKKQTILITGANGYIGSNVVKCVCDNQEIFSRYNFIATSRNNTNIDSRIHYVPYDVLNNYECDGMYEKLGSPDIVIHLAINNGFIHNADSHISELHKHFMFLRNMVDHGTCRLAVLGTVHEIGNYEGKVIDETPCNPVTYYGITKNALRQMLTSLRNERKFDLTWLRAFYIYGDDTNSKSVFHKLLEADRAGAEYFNLTTGESKFDFIHISELARQILVASISDQGLGIINVCSGVPHSLKEIILKYIEENNLRIKPRFGFYPERLGNSSLVYGDNTKISEIMKGFK